jgi:hypothetical protein
MLRFKQSSPCSFSAAPIFCGDFGLDLLNQEADSAHELTTKVKMCPQKIPSTVLHSLNQVLAAFSRLWLQ